MTPRALLVFSADVEGVRRAVADGTWPNKDFLELPDRLQAGVIDYRSVECGPWRLLRRVLGVPVTQAVMAFARAGDYDVIYTDGEHIGLPLALLLRLRRRRPKHLTIGHLLDTPSKRWVLRWLRPAGQLDRVLLHASLQREIAVSRLGLPADRLVLAPFYADPDFWSPRPSPTTEPMICTGGLEYRDYPTLMRAVRDLPVRVVIAAGSRWSRHRSTADDEPVPTNVEVTSLEYPALRDLYADARFIVVPLRDVENQAGVTTILEAMAMGKAVIVTATRGQTDVIRGRLCTALGLAATAQGGPAPFGAEGPLAEAETGIYVPPEDSAALRRAIAYLLQHPEEAERMGANGRRMIEQHISLDLFCRRIAQILSDLDQERRLSRPRPVSEGQQRALAGQSFGRK
jgi:glycosyltransferase involved in cell wall biosynthesis